MILSPRLLFLSRLCAAIIVVSHAGPLFAFDGVTLLDPKSKSCRIFGEGMTCSGLGGWKIAVGYHSLEPTIVFIPPGSKLGDAMMAPTDGKEISIFNIGPTGNVFWVGSSAIVPLQFLSEPEHEKMIELGRPPKNPHPESLFAVIWIDKEGTCIVAYVDQTNPDAEKLAHETASKSSAVKCPVPSISIVGKASNSLLNYMSR